MSAPQVSSEGGVSWPPGDALSYRRRADPGMVRDLKDAVYPFFQSDTLFLE